ncbi:MAG: DUF72 domain-containing protein [Nakamurella multipartita]
MLVAFSVAPAGGRGERNGVDDSGSVSAAVAAAIAVVGIRACPIARTRCSPPWRVEWDECMAVVRQCCEVVGHYGSRVSLVLKADIRPGHTGELTGKVAGSRRPWGPARSVTASIRIGLSSWRYPHWRGGAFYPSGLVQRRELEYVSRVFDTLELNGPFYSLQRPSSFARWRDTTPDGFVFAVKGSRFITHLKKPSRHRRGVGRLLRLRPARSGRQARGRCSGNCRPCSATGRTGWPRSWVPCRGRGGRRPGSPAAASSILDRFGEQPTALTVADASAPLRHAVEVRHDSFAIDSFYELCRQFGVALVVADTAGRYTWIDQVTARAGLRAAARRPRDVPQRLFDEGIAWWADRVRGWADTPGVTQVIVYFDNDRDAHAPHDALQLARRARSNRPSRPAHPRMAARSP